MQRFEDVSCYTGMFYVLLLFFKWLDFVYACVE